MREWLAIRKDGQPAIWRPVDLIVRVHRVPARAGGRYAVELHPATWRLLRHGDANASDVLRVAADGSRTTYRRRGVQWSHVTHTGAQTAPIAI
jgi:hypothetical protein